MVSKQELLRQRVVTFYLKYPGMKKSFTVNHFMAEGIPRITVNNINNTYINRLTTKRKVCSGQTLKVMTRS